jgi:hypothetical protein
LYFSSLEFHFANSNLVPVETECLTKKPRRAAKPGSLFPACCGFCRTISFQNALKGQWARSLAAVSAQVVIGSQPFIWVDPSVAAQLGLAV